MAPALETVGTESSSQAVRESRVDALDRSKLTMIGSYLEKDLKSKDARVISEQARNMGAIGRSRQTSSLNLPKFRVAFTAVDSWSFIGQQWLVVRCDQY